MDDAVVRNLRAVCRLATLLAEACARLEASLPPEDPKPPRPGRPVAAPSRAQVEEVLRLKHTNGQMGLRIIGERVGLGWSVVQRILEEHAPSENPAAASENPSPAEGGEVPLKPSTRQGKEV